MKSLSIELKKQPVTNLILSVIVPIFISGLLFIALKVQYEAFLLRRQAEMQLSNWQLIYRESEVVFTNIFLGIFVGVIAYELFAVETKNNAWNILASTKYIKKDVFVGKILLGEVYLIIYILLAQLGVLVNGIIVGVEGPIEWKLFAKVISIQILASIMMLTFYIMALTIVKRVAIIIASYVVMCLLHYSYGYTTGFKYYMINSYFSYAFKASDEQWIKMILVSAIFSVVFILISKICLSKNREIS